MPTNYRDWDAAKLRRLTDAATELLADGTDGLETLVTKRTRWIAELERRESVHAEREAAMAACMRAADSSQYVRRAWQNGDLLPCGECRYIEPLSD